MNFKKLQIEVHKNAVEHGWWEEVANENDAELYDEDDLEVQA